jgi:inner membrane protein
MSPITHGLIGWLVSQPLSNRKDRVITTSAALLPDIDGAGIIISIDYYSKYHHVFGHNLLFGLLLSAISYTLAKEKMKAAILVLLSFNTHILGDLLGSGAGWGIPYWWPLSKKQYEFSAPFQWELDSWQNLLATFLCILLIVFMALKKDRTVVEIFSENADKKVVAVFKKWLG